jgi:uncharacterized glyoxalase superfamily protein PhnB
MRVAPELPVNDIGESLRHYQEKLGFEVVMTRPEGDYAIVERDGVALHLFRNDAPPQTPGSIHVFVDGLDDLHAELQARGAELTQEIIRKPWGNREFRLVDSSGNSIKFTEPLDGPA